ncbi:hypothetical protein SNEBB_001776 [Seison nebaliae]|nr:hypothetical protein SNEBB_001776 [Seison nebaliae]
MHFPRVDIIRGMKIVGFKLLSFFNSEKRDELVRRINSAYSTPKRLYFANSKCYIDIMDNGHLDDDYVEKYLKTF